MQANLFLYADGLGDYLRRKATSWEKKKIQNLIKALGKDLSILEDGMKWLADALKKRDPAKGRSVEVPLVGSLLGFGVRRPIPVPDTHLFQALGVRRWIEAWWTNRGLEVEWRKVLGKDHEGSFHVSFPKNGIHILQGPTCDVFVLVLSW